MARPWVRTVAALRKAALTFPEATEDHPWGESAFKVRGKVFLFLSHKEDHLSLSMKLPSAAAFALDLSFTEPTGYGLGRSGWVTATFTSEADVPLPLLFDWLEESFRAIAPKRLAATLEAKPAPRDPRSRR